jgi:hypothetical protein
MLEVDTQAPPFSSSARTVQYFSPRMDPLPRAYGSANSNSVESFPEVCTVAFQQELSSFGYGFGLDWPADDPTMTPLPLEIFMETERPLDDMGFSGQ